MYKIKHAGPKGLGVFAVQLIPRGTRIFSEPPLLALRQHQDASHIFKVSRLLSPNDRREFLKLSTTISAQLSFIRWTHTIWYSLKQAVSDIRRRLDWTFPTPRSLREHQKFISIFRNNAFDLGSKSQVRQAVFKSIARINHSCTPNAQGNFNNLHGLFNVHATRAIAPGEEVTISYLSEHGAPRASRQNQLKSGYNFECICPACDLSTLQGRDGETRRIQVLKDIGTYGEQVTSSGVTDQATELKLTLALIGILEKDGIAGRELATM
jgi:hypothetical protein